MNLNELTKEENRQIMDKKCWQTVNYSRFRLNCLKHNYITYEGNVGEWE